MKVISERFFIEGGAKTYERIVEIKGKRLRSTVTSASTAADTMSQIHLWDKTSWNLVHSLSSSEMTTPIDTVTFRPDITRQLFQADETKLLNVAKKVLGLWSIYWDGPS